MDDSIPMPIPADSESEKEALRAEEVERVAEMGQKRSEKEQMIQVELRKKSLNEEEKARRFTDRSRLMALQAKDEAKKFRKEKLQREKEIAAQKEHEEQLRKIEEERRQQQAEEQKKKDGYFKDLREIARLKILHDHQEYARKREEETARKSAALEHTTAVEASMRADRNRQLEIDGVKRMRLSQIERETHAALFHMESEERTRLRQLETDIGREMEHLKSEEDPVLRQRKQKAVELSARARRSAIEADIQKKRKALESEDHHKRAAAESEAYGQREASHREYLHDNQKADKILGDRLNDIALRFGQHRFGRGQ